MEIDTRIKDRFDALGFFKLMGIKEITTARQKKNGTTVYELPIRKLSYTGNSYAYRYAIYDSGYIRDISEHCSSPWYINKRYVTKSKYWNSYYKEYYTYTGSKPVFINDFDDQLVFLANYILKNRYGSKLYSCCDWNSEQIKECSDFRYKARWDGDTVTIPRDEYKKLQRTQWEKDNGVFDTWGTNKNSSDDIQVIINGTRYNLS
tara:strand:- start:197 stop:811 length:615 start_codon:yes stop_codon:yes gene_type:complete